MPYKFNPFTGELDSDSAGGAGTSGYSGISGYSGYSGISGYSGGTGSDGASGYSGYSGISGYSGYSGISGYSGFSGISGYSGYSGISGYSGYSGISGYSGFSGISGYSGYSGISGYSGSAASNLVTSVFGRSGAVVAAANDYTWAQLNLSVSSIADITTRTHSLLSSLTADDHTQYPLLIGRAGGQTLIGGINASDTLTLQSTSHATKGKILFGTSAYDEVNNRLGIGTVNPTQSFDIGGGLLTISSLGKVYNNVFYTTDGIVTDDRLYQIIATVSSDNATANRYPRGMFAQIVDSGSTDFGGASQLWGLQGQAVHQSNININEMVGLVGATIFSLGAGKTITTTRGLLGKIQINVNGTATTAIGVDSNFYIQSFTLTATNVYYFKGSINSTTGAISVVNAYGLYLPDINYGSVLNYAIYTGIGLVRFGDVMFPVQAPTVSAPTYVKGGIYFDTTLNKLRVGGAVG